MDKNLKMMSVITFHAVTLETLCYERQNSVKKITLHRITQKGDEVSQVIALLIHMTTTKFCYILIFGIFIFLVKYVL